EGESWLGRLALVAAVAVAPLILIGGTVTSTESGMAVTGWPDTFGANMFLYPISLMSEPRVYFEHTHRLFGAMVGLCFLTLTVLTLATPAGKGVRFWVVLTFAVVCVQGLLGGLRVTENNAHLGIVHGVLAQVVLALAVCTAAWLTPLYRTAVVEAHAGDRKRKALATGVLHATLMQLVLGAAFRHLRRVDSPGAMHALWTHIAFALVVVGLAFAAGFLLRSRPGTDRVSRLIRRLGTGLVVVVGVQFALGWVAFWAVLTTPRRGPVPTTDQLPHAEAVPVVEAVVATLHQANGALLIALAALAVVWTRRAWRAGGENPASTTG
ncbi:MAG TPA: COX15/CtaA family protein, partial [Phycisphaerales bacterium]|nr:COX15/CtaA family protein [Phycisphaerales bacterium]